MSNLFSLPEEIFGAILEELVKCGMNHALTAKLVCKRFDVEVTRAICATRLLERDDIRGRKVGRPLATAYLVARTLANDVTHELCPSHAILDVVDELCRRDPGAVHQREQYIWALAQASLDCWNSSIDDWRDGDLYAIKMGVTPQYPQRTMLENLFAASALLGMKSLFDELRSKQVPHENTFFGHPLKCAVLAGHTDIVADFLRTSELAKQCLYDYRTLQPPRIYLNRCLSPKMVRCLLDPRLTGDAPSGFYRRILAHAASQGDQALTILCLDRAQAEGHREEICCPHSNHGPFPHSKTFAQEWILLFAAQGGQFDLVLSTLQQGVDVTACWHRGINNPLIMAISQGYFDIVELLLKYGATDSPYAVRFSSVVCDAAQTGSVAMLRLLLDHGLDMNMKVFGDGPTPTVTAARYGHLDALRLLLRRGANLGSVPLQATIRDASRHGQFGIVEELSKHVASLS